MKSSVQWGCNVKKILTALMLLLSMALSAGAGTIYGKTVFMGDVEEGSWVAVTNITAVPTNTTGGAYDSGTRRFVYRVNGTNLAGRLPSSQETNVTFVGSASTNAVYLTWDRYDGVAAVVVEKSSDAGTNWTWRAFPPDATFFLDYGSGTWTSGIFTNLYSIISSPNVLTSLFSQITTDLIQATQAVLTEAIQYTDTNVVSSSAITTVNPKGAGTWLVAKNGNHTLDVDPLIAGGAVSFSITENGLIVSATRIFEDLQGYSNNVAVYPYQLVVSGFTSDWEMMNGTYTYITTPLPYYDIIEHDGHPMWKQEEMEGTLYWDNAGGNCYGIAMAGYDFEFTVTNTTTADNPRGTYKDLTGSGQVGTVAAVPGGTWLLRPRSVNGSLTVLGVVTAETVVVSQAVLPENATVDLGSEDHPFRDLHISGSSIKVGGVPILSYTNGEVQVGGLTVPTNTTEYIPLTGFSYIHPQNFYLFSFPTNVPEWQVVPLADTTHTIVFTNFSGKTWTGVSTGDICQTAFGTEPGTSWTTNATVICSSTGIRTPVSFSWIPGNSLYYMPRGEIAVSNEFGVLSGYFTNTIVPISQ